MREDVLNALFYILTVCERMCLMLCFIFSQYARGCVECFVLCSHSMREDVLNALFYILTVCERMCLMLCFIFSQYARGCVECFVLYSHSMREDVFNALLEVEKNHSEGLKPEGKRFLERMIKLGRRNGKQSSMHVDRHVKS